MGGTDLEFMHNWKFEFGSNQFVRKRPARLRDREALKSLLAAFARHAGSNGFIIDFDDVDYDATLPFDELVDLIPPRVSRLHLQTNGSPTLVVHINSQHGGRTWVHGYGTNAAEYGSPLPRLANLVEANCRNLPWTRVLGRLRWRRLARLLRPSIYERSRRDDLAARAADRRTALIGGFWGVIGGVVATIVTVLTGLGS